MSKLLANQIANYGDDAPIEIKEGLNIPAGKPIQAGGVAGSAGQVLSSTGATIQWVTPFDGDYNSLTNTPTIPAAQVPSDWNASGGLARILNKPVVPQQPSVTTTAVGTAALAYNSTNGEFTFTPPDLTNSTNWDTAYGWGNHASAGYLTAEVDTLDSVCERGKTNLSGGGFGVLTDVRIVGTDGIKASYFGCGALGGASQGDLTITHNDNSHASSIRHGNTLNDLEIRSVNKIEFYTGTSETLRLEVTDIGVNVNGTVNLGSGNLFTAGKVYYANNFSTIASLPNASSYHGMFAHVHDTGKGYFSHNNVTSIAVTVGVDTVAGQSTGVFYFNGVEKPGSFIIRRGVTYTFDQSDSSNATYASVHHPLMISATLDGELNGGSHYMTGVTYKLDGVVKTMAQYVSGFVAATTRTVEWTPAASAPDTLYYWCHFHTGQGNSFSIGDGSWVELLDTNSSLADLAGVDLSTPPATGQVLKFDGSHWVPAADGGGGGGGISLTDISVTTASAGTPALTYNNVSGVFTYTPPDLTPYAQTANLSIANWDAAHGWGNHASAGYLVATSSDKTNWNTAYGWGNHASAGYLTSLGTALVDADFTTNGLMKRTAAGTYTSITDNSTNWDAAYAWGNHSAQGYLQTVALNTVSDVTITSPQTNDVLTYNGSGWVNSAPSGGGASVTISDTPPAASPGDLWWESDSGRLKIRYQDTDSTQWVDVAPPLSSALSTDAPATATSSGTLGDIRMDTDFIYVCVGTNAWKRVAIAVW